MKLVEISCPNCKGTLKVNPEKDVLVCGYCHTEFKVDDEIKKVEINKTIHHVYTDEAKIKREENNRIYAEEKRKTKQIQSKHSIIIAILIIGAVVAYFVSFNMYFDNEEKKSLKQEAELQQIVEEVKIDVKNGDYDDAYLKAKSIYYTEGWSHEIEDKWENTRKEMIDYVIREEKKATGKSEHESETGFWDSIFK